MVGSSKSVRRPPPLSMPQNSQGDMGKQKKKRGTVTMVLSLLLVCAGIAMLTVFLLPHHDALFHYLHTHHVTLHSRSGGAAAKASEMVTTTGATTHAAAAAGQHSVKVVPVPDENGAVAGARSPLEKLRSAANLRKHLEKHRRGSDTGREDPVASEANGAADAGAAPVAAAAGRNVERVDAVKQSGQEGTAKERLVEFRPPPRGPDISVEPVPPLAPLPVPVDKIQPASAFAICTKFPQACTCPVRDPSFVFYNRVPKCASGSMRVFMEHAQPFTKIGFCRGKKFFTRYLDPRRVAALRRGPSRAVCGRSFARPSRTVLNWHAVYASFPSDMPAQDKPVYINVIREPIGRIYSRYYYDRDRWGAFKPKLSMDRCFQPGSGYCEFASNSEVERRSKPFHVGLKEYNSASRSRESMFNLEAGTNYLTFWFCGMNESCATGNLSTLEEAKRVMAEEYAFVGLQSKMNETFFIMQTMFPDWFGPWGTVLGELGEPCDKCVHADRPPMQAATRAKLEKLFWMDIPLYQFTEELFEAKLHACLRVAHQADTEHGHVLPAGAKSHKR